MKDGDEGSGSIYAGEEIGDEGENAVFECLLPEKSNEVEKTLAAYGWKKEGSFSIEFEGNRGSCSAGGLLRLF